MITDSRARFQTGTERYARCRPDYPPSLIRFIAERIASLEAPPNSPIVDVGSGTGIFARQLASSLPTAIPLIGIEPSLAMREQAEFESSHTSITYRHGGAEDLPFGQNTVRAVLAATAAHWFDRPLFYREAERVLIPGGLLGITEYVRDEVGSAAARAVVEFLDNYGEQRAYVRPDYMAEIDALPGFGPVDLYQESATLFLTPEEFAGLALSSSHARQAVQRLGLEQAHNVLGAIAAELINQNGDVPFGYVFQGFLSARL